MRLMDIPLFKNLRDDEIESLGSMMKIVSLKDGEILFNQGDPSEYVYVIQRGNVRVFATHDDVEETYTNLGMGAIFGEIGVIKDQARTASVAAMGDVALLAFDGTKFRELVETNPYVSQIVLNTMFGRFRADSERAEQRRRKQEGTKIISVFSATGGSGVSTVAANLALHLTEITKKRILLVDLDLMFGDQGSILGMDDGLTMSEIVMNPDLDKAAIEEVLHATPYGFHLLKAPEQPEHAEFVVPGFVDRCIGLVADTYDYIIFDTTRTLSDVSLDLLDRTDIRVYVMLPETPAIHNGARWMNVATRLGVPLTDTKVVVNRVGPDDETTLEYIKKRFSEVYAQSLPEDPTHARKALNVGKPVSAASPTCPLSQGIRKLAGSLVGLELTEPPERSGFFSKWL